MNKKSKFLILSIFVASLLIFISFSNGSVSRVSTLAEGIYLVTKVIDGDTFEIETGQRVRYLGIDAPEINTSAGQSAHKYHQDLVLEKKVKLEFDQDRLDNYERILAYVWLDDLLINKDLVEEGYARVSYLPTENEPKYLKELKKAEEKAKSLNKGLWDEDN